MPRGITAKGLATRRRIVEGAAAVVREQGVAATGLEDIRQATGVSSSQLFHYFPEGKSELMLAVARFAADQILLVQEPELGALAERDLWREWSARLFAHYEAQGPHCDLSALTSQLGPGEPAVREIVREMQLRWQEHLAEGVRSLQRRGEANPALDPQTAAAALVAGIQGGVLMMTSTESSAHLHAVVDTWLAGLGYAGTAR